MKSSLLRDLRYARLMRGAQRGDDGAFRLLYRELLGPVSGYLGSRIRRAEVVEDLTATVFYKFVERLDQWDRRRGGVLSWILTITHHTMIDHFRSAHDGEPLSDLGQIPSPGLDPLEDLIVSETDRRLGVMIERLPLDSRQLLELRFVHNLRHREIAQMMQTTEQAIKKRCSRLIHHLKSELAASADECHERKVADER